MPEQPPRSSPSTDDSEVIPGYPADLEHTIVLAGGSEVFVRPIRPDDADALRRAISTADDETLYARFLGLPPGDAASIQRLVTVDYRWRLALVAFAPDGTGVAIARYEGQPDSADAEVAVVVAPGWRRLGLGSRLLRDLGLAALDRGINRFEALLLADNGPALATLHASGLVFSSEIDHGTSRLSITLSEG